MQPDCVVALDAGSGSGRATVFDLNGTLLGAASEDWSPHVPEDEPLGAEFHPQEMWAALGRTTRQALERAGIGAASVRGISATSQRDGCVFLDAEGNELLCSTNRDARGVMHAEDLAKEFGATVYRVTGRWPLGLNALDRLGWLRIHRPEVYDRVATVLMISDWIIYRLSGLACSEPTNASSSLLFDVGQVCWSSEVTGLLGHSHHVCPPCYLPGHLAGSLTASAAQDLGLVEGIPVAVGAGDSQAACLGCAAFDDGVTTIIAGTTVPVQMVLSHPVFDALHRIHLGAYVLPERWVLESNGGLAGTSYRWFCETFVGSGAAAYATLEKEMQGALPGEVMAVVGPQVADFRELAFPPRSLFTFPFLAATDRPPGRGGFGRAVLENIAFAVRGNVDQLTDIGGQPVTALNLCGGLAHSGLLTHIVADVCQMTVHVPRVREASALGAAICAAVGCGAYCDLVSAARAMVQWEEAVEPDTASVRRYRGLYRKWTALFASARGL
jgi:autoinducer 2 (AI-2) kinase